ncbi:hypothetical protein ACTXT7_010023 [Hymenolepis weldensis]
MEFFYKAGLFNVIGDARIQVVSTLSMFGDQKNPELITVRVPKDRTNIRSGVRPCIDKDDVPLGDNLWTLIISRQDIPFMYRVHNNS